MRQYSADSIRVAWVGADLTKGLAAGTFVQESREVPTWRKKADGFGGIVYLFNPNGSGEITLLFDAESKEHQDLRTIALADRLVKSFVAPLTIRNTTTEEVHFYNRARIMTDPDLQLAVGPSVVPWTWGFESVTRQAFARNANVVGD